MDSDFIDGGTVSSSKSADGLLDFDDFDENDDSDFIEGLDFPDNAFIDGGTVGGSSSSSSSVHDGDFLELLRRIIAFILRGPAGSLRHSKGRRPDGHLSPAPSDRGAPWYTPPCAAR